MGLLSRSPVLVLRTRYDAVAARLAELDAVAPLSALRAADAVAVKINLCDARTPETGAVTDPRFLDALLGWIRERNPRARLLVAESDGLAVLAERYCRWFGVDEVLQRRGAAFVNLTGEPVVEREVRGRHLRRVPVPRVLAESFVVSLTKLKTNLLSTITCALKNQFGCLPMIDKFRLHPKLADVIVDVNLALRPGLFVVDGIVGQGGIQGPAFGTPVAAGVVLAGRDPVAIDAAACHVLSQNPLLVAHLRKAWLSGIGSLRYRVVGDALPRVPFENHAFETGVFRLGGRLKRLTQQRDRRATA